MKLINLTPHEINIYDFSGKIEILRLSTSGTIARYTDNEKYEQETNMDDVDIPVFTSQKSSVVGMPEPSKGIIYVVATPIRVLLKDREDIASPGELIRNDKGQPIGCRGLIFNKLRI